MRRITRNGRHHELIFSGTDRITYTSKFLDVTNLTRRGDLCRVFAHITPSFDPAT